MRAIEDGSSFAGGRRRVWCRAGDGARLPGSPPNLTPTLYLACARAASVDPRNGRSVVDAYDGEHPADPAPLAYSITLPEPVDADAIDASLETGVLKVTVPKSKPSQRRRIELK